MRRRRKSEAGKKSNVIFRITSRWMLLLLRSSIKRQCHWRGKKPSEAKMVFKKDNIRLVSSQHLLGGRLSQQSTLLVMLASHLTALT